MSVSVDYGNTKKTQHTPVRLGSAALAATALALDSLLQQLDFFVFLFFVCSPRVLPLATIPEVGTVNVTNPDPDVALPR